MNIEIGIMKVTSIVDEKTILSLLDVVGSCIVDILYNHMYDRAISIHEKTSTGLTECYRQSLNEYVNERTNPRFYTVLLNSIHHYTRMSTVYNEISYSECVNLYSLLFIPQMYHTSLTNEQKMNILTMLLGETIQEFVAEILHSHISCIIDDHNDSINIEILQDCVLKILLSKRDKTYERFIDSQKNEKRVVSNDKQRYNDKSEALIKLTDAFKKSVNERMNLKKKNTQLVKKNKLLVKQFEDLKKLFLSQLSVQKEQAALIKDLKKELQKTPEPEKEEDEELFSVQYVEENHM